MPNALSPLSSSTSAYNQIAQLNKNFARLDKELVTKQFKGTNDESLIIGQLANKLAGIEFDDSSGKARIYMAIENGEPVFKVAKSGFDAKTAGDNDLIFNSNQNNLKIVKTGTRSVNISGTFPSFTPQTATIQHGATTTPSFICYVNNPNYSTFSGLTASSVQGLTATPQIVYFKDLSSNIAPLVNITARVDSTNLYLDVTNLTAFTTGFPNWTWDFRYYILQESAT